MKSGTDVGVGYRVLGSQGVIGPGEPGVPSTERDPPETQGETLACSVDSGNVTSSPVTVVVSPVPDLRPVGSRVSLPFDLLRRPRRHPLAEEDGPFPDKGIRRPTVFRKSRGTQGLLY